MVYLRRIKRPKPKDNKANQEVNRHCHHQCRKGFSNDLGFLDNNRQHLKHRRHHHHHRHCRQYHLSQYQGIPKRLLGIYLYRHNNRHHQYLLALMHQPDKHRHYHLPHLYQDRAIPQDH